MVDVIVVDQTEVRRTGPGGRMGDGQTVGRDRGHSLSDDNNDEYSNNRNNDGQSDRVCKWEERRQEKQRGRMRGEC